MCKCVLFYACIKKWHIFAWKNTQYVLCAFVFFCITFLILLYKKSTYLPIYLHLCFWTQHSAIPYLAIKYFYFSLSGSFFFFFYLLNPHYSAWFWLFVMWCCRIEISCRNLPLICSTCGVLPSANLSATIANNAVLVLSPLLLSSSSYTKAPLHIVHTYWSILAYTWTLFHTYM